MEKDKKNRLDAQNENTGKENETGASGEGTDVLEQMKKYLVDAPEEMAREAEAYMAEHPDTPEEAAARKARFFARLEEEKAKAEEAATAEAAKEPAAHTEKVPFYRRRSSKILTAVAACLVVLIAIPMVSQSARVAMRDMVLQIFGSGASGFTYDKSTSQPYSEEEVAWNEIAEKLGVDRIGFDERPEALSYNKCEVYADAFQARVYYQQRNNLVRINVEKYFSADMDSNGIDVDHQAVDDVEVPLIGQMVTIWEWDAIGESKYYASITYNGAVYNIYYYDNLDAMKEFISHIYFY